MIEIDTKENVPVITDILLDVSVELLLCPAAVDKVRDNEAAIFGVKIQHSRSSDNGEHYSVSGKIRDVMYVLYFIGQASASIDQVS